MQNAEIRFSLSKKILIFTFCILNSALSSPAWAVRHIHDAYPHPPKDGIHSPNAAAMRTFGSLHAAIAGGATGTKKVAVIIVQFPASSCGGCTSGNSSIQSLSNIDNYFTQMANYYNEASYKKVTLQFSFFGPNDSNAGGDSSAATAQAYLLAHPIEYYGCGDEGAGCSGVTTPAPGIRPNGDYLISDALAAASKGLNGQPGHGGNPTSSSYDALTIVHAGNGNETTTTPGDIWSIFYSQDASVIQLNNTSGFTEGDVDPETEASGITSPLGVMCHEFGHTLGLPDLYNTQAGVSVVGFWELMDNGPYDGNGANPSHPGAWDKQFLGWATAQTVSTSGNFTIGPVETNSAILKFPVQNGGSQEYFLGEYRSQNSGAAYDQKIPGTGLLIWHVDDQITSTRGISATTEANTVNTGSPHYGVSVITANGVTITSTNPGDGGNVFTNGSIFSSPKSDNFSSQPTGISIVNISGVGTGSLTLTAADLTVAATQSILKLVNYPNPAGKGYAHLSGESHTTIQFQLSRPANSYSINIYNLSADLVRKVSQDEITLNINRSANNKWVYEFDWDLKNGDGAMVAPGVYIYLIRADGLTQTGKAVIIR